MSGIEARRRRGVGGVERSRGRGMGGIEVRRGRGKSDVERSRGRGMDGVEGSRGRGKGAVIDRLYEYDENDESLTERVKQKNHSGTGVSKLVSEHGRRSGNRGVALLKFENLWSLQKGLGSQSGKPWP